MRIVAFNSSPRDNSTSKTEMMLQKFLEGARKAGATTETIYLRTKHINHCHGCFSCWLKSKGRCIQADDMSEELFNAFIQADVVVLATPLYDFNMNARLKAFIERTLPMLDSTFLDYHGRTYHPLRWSNPPRIIALSVCAFPEQDNFQALSLTMKMIFGTLLGAEIYRPASEFFFVPKFQPQINQVLSAIAQAGEEVVRHGKVDPLTMDRITQDLAPRQELIQMANEFWMKRQEQTAPDIDDSEHQTISKWV
jgi:hypothetical protein